MVRYRFVEWRDETEAVVATTPSISILITSDKTLTAMYEAVKRIVSYKSSPLAVDAIVDTTKISSGGSVEVDDGATLVFSVPEEVEA